MGVSFIKDESQLQKRLMCSRRRVTVFRKF